jgi:hypothetical protein
MFFRNVGIHLLDYMCHNLEHSSFDYAILNFLDLSENQFYYILCYTAEYVRLQ